MTTPSTSYPMWHRIARRCHAAKRHTLTTLGVPPRLHFSRHREAVLSTAVAQHWRAAHARDRGRESREGRIHGSLDSGANFIRAATCKRHRRRKRHWWSRRFRGAERTVSSCGL
jgi:hypothetical protein